MNSRKTTVLIIVLLSSVMSIQLLSDTGFDKLSKEYSRIMQSWKKHSADKRSTYRAERDKALQELLKRLKNTPEQLLLKTRILLNLDKTSAAGKALGQAATIDEENYYKNDVTLLTAIYNIKSGNFETASEKLRLLPDLMRKSQDYKSSCLAMAFHSKSIDEKINYARQYLSHSISVSSDKHRNSVESLLAELYNFRGMKKDAEKYSSSHSATYKLLKSTEQPVPQIKIQRWFPSSPGFNGFKGRVTILHFWTAAVKKPEESLDYVKTVTSSIKNLNIYCISRISGHNPSDRSVIEPSVEYKTVNDKYKSSYPSFRFFSTLNGEIFSSLGVKKLPATIIIDKDGKIDTVSFGNIPVKDIRAKIRQLSEVKYGTN